MVSVSDHFALPRLAAICSRIHASTSDSIQPTARAARHRRPPIGGQDPPSGNRLKGGSAGWGLETEDRVVCGEYLALLDYKLDRREELERKVEALIVEPAYREAVGCLCGLKVISTQAAMVPVTKIGDFRRFEHPCKLMAYVGLVPSGHSSS